MWDKINSYWDKIDTYVEENHIIQEGETIVAGISGGADSICLMRYLLHVKEKKNLSLYGVHVNHLLRGEEADRDESFVREFCNQWKIPLSIYKKDVRKISRSTRCSLEEAGRQVRYECFCRLAKELGGAKIAVAHHKNDLAETVLFRMVRGTGLSGLAGIRPVNGTLIRPLLCLEKSEVLEILIALGQEYVEDSTNVDEDYSRNFIRHRILPELEQINAAAVEHLGRLSGQAAELFEYLEPIFLKKYEGAVQSSENGCFLKETAWKKMHVFEQKEILRRMLFEISGKQKDISSVHVEQLLDMLGKTEGKQKDFPYGIRARRQKDGILLYHKDMKDNPEEKSGETYEETEIPPLEDGQVLSLRWGELEFVFHLQKYVGDEIIKKDCVKYFDYGRIKCKMCLRTRRSGDYFIMDKNGRHKSLNRYFIDEKIPTGQRDRKPLLADGSHIMWIPGGRISEEYKVRAETKQILVVEMKVCIR